MGFGLWERVFQLWFWPAVRAIRRRILPLTKSGVKLAWLIPAGMAGVFPMRSAKKTGTRFFIASFSSDWLFPTRESRSIIVHALNATGISVSFVKIETDKGHDAFLLHEPVLFSAVNGFLQVAARARGFGQ